MRQGNVVVFLVELGFWKCCVFSIDCEIIYIYYCVLVHFGGNGKQKMCVASLSSVDDCFDIS